MEIYATVKQVAERYGVSTASVWRWTNDPSTGFPKPVSLSPGTTRWKVSELAAWEAAKASSLP
jgi:prophage regulatory protein